MCLQCSHIFLDELILRFYFRRLGDNIAHKRLTGLYIFTRRLGDVGKCVCDRHGIGNDVLNPSGHGSLFLNACDCALHAYGNVAHCLADAAGCLCHLLDQRMNGLGGFIDGCADGHDGIHHILLLFLVGFQFGELLCVVQDGHAGRQAGDCVDDNNNGADDKDHIGFGKRVGSKHMDRVNTV